MELTGEKIVEAQQVDVFDALQDPEVLRAIVPGAVALHVRDAANFELIVHFGDVNETAPVPLAVEFYDVDAPNGYALRAAGYSAAGGAVEVDGSVALETIGEASTKVDYRLQIDFSEMGGLPEQDEMDQLGEAILREFFSRLRERLGGAQATSRLVTGDVARYRAPAGRRGSAEPAAGSNLRLALEGASTSPLGGATVNGAAAAGGRDAHNGTTARRNGVNGRTGSTGSPVGAASSGPTGVVRWVLALLGAGIIALLLSDGF